MKIQWQVKRRTLLEKAFAALPNGGALIVYAPSSTTSAAATPSACL
ncbi:UNVERIFIED_ORG: hypothetical protein GGD43_000040 [Rhizobium esperanzae]